MGKKKLISFITILSLITIILTSFNVFKLYNIVDTLENSFFKYLTTISADRTFIKNNYQKMSNDIIIVLIDTLSSQKIAQHPNFESNREQWPRKRVAKIINYIEKGKPKVIINDLHYEGKEDNALSDNKIITSFKHSKNIITSLSMSPSKQGLTELSTIELSDKEWIKKYNIQSEFLDKRFQLDIDDNQLTNKNIINEITFYDYTRIYNPILTNANRIGIVNVPYSKFDRIIRTHKPIFKHSTKNGYAYYPSLPLASVLSILPENEKQPFKITNKEIIIGKRKIPLNNEGNFLINWHGPRFTYTALPAYRLLFSSAYNKKQIKNIDKKDYVPLSDFKDKIVIIGKITGNDLHTTPVSMNFPGPEVVATCIDNILNDTNPDIKNRKKIVQKANLLQNIAFTLLVLIAIGVYNIRQKESHLILIWSFIWALILILAVILAFVHLRIWFSWVYPMIALITLSTVIYVKRINELNTEKKEIEDVFGHYVSPQVLQKVLSDRNVSLTPDRKYLTVIFADIRGFTTLSEKHEANELIPQLNEYFDEMYNIIISHDGTMDKFIGDAVMAFWGDPLPFEDHAKKAVQASKDMMKAVIKLNMKWKREGKPQLKIGIGINTGEMIVGPMGASRMVNYTVFGDSVNLASRIESLNKTYGTSILIGESTYNSIKDETDATYVDEVIVKGKNIAVKIYKII